MGKIIDLEAYRRELAYLDEYAMIWADQYEAIYHEPNEDRPDENRDN